MYKSIACLALLAIVQPCFSQNLPPPLTPPNPCEIVQPDPNAQIQADYQAAVVAYNATIVAYKTNVDMVNTSMDIVSNRYAKLLRKYDRVNLNLSDAQKSLFASGKAKAAAYIVDTAADKGDAKRAMILASQELENARLSLSFAAMAQWTRRARNHTSTIMYRIDMAADDLLTADAWLDVMDVALTTP